MRGLAESWSLWRWTQDDQMDGSGSLRGWGQERPCATEKFIKFSVTVVASHPDRPLRSENCCQCEHQCCSYQEIGRADLALLFKMRYMLPTIIHRDYFLCFGWFTGGKIHTASPWLHLSEAQMITNSTHSNVSMRSCKDTKNPTMTRLWGCKYWILSSGDIKPQQFQFLSGYL